MKAHQHCFSHTDSDPVTGVGSGHGGSCCKCGTSPDYGLTDQSAQPLFPVPSNPREEWIARARKVVFRCDETETDRREMCVLGPPPNPCALHEAIATGLAQAFYNGVKVGLADLPDEGPIEKRLVGG